LHEPKRLFKVVSGLDGCLSRGGLDRTVSNLRGFGPGRFPVRAMAEIRTVTCTACSH
jgi:hypothetical protein